MSLSHHHKYKYNLSQEQFKCETCNKVYTNKTCYNKHTLICKIIKSNNPEPYRESLHNIAIIVSELVKSNSKLEKDVSKLKNYIQSKQRKFVITNWLNKNYMSEDHLPTYNFNQFISNIIITRQHLENIFDSTFIDGIDKILQSILDLNNNNNNNTNNNNNNTLPLKAFDQKNNTIYVFKENWGVLSSEDLDKLFSSLTKKILAEFKLWQDENEHKLYTEEFSIIYVTNIQKVLGNKLTSQQQKNIIRTGLYKLLKTDLQNLIEYEFT